MDQPETRALSRATLLLREFVDANEAFEKTLGTELGVNATDLEAMEQLIMSGPLTPTELSRRLGISTASTTTAIDRLVALEHAHREPNPGDRRGVLVVPSPRSAERAMSRLMPMIHGLDRELADFTDDEQLVITAYLQRVVDRYRSHAAPGDERTEIPTTAD